MCLPEAPPRAPTTVLPMQRENASLDSDTPPSGDGADGRGDWGTQGLELLAERDVRLHAEVLAAEAVARADRLAAELVAVAMDRDAAQAERDANRRDFDAARRRLDAEVADLRQQLAAVHASRWWRASAALRRTRGRWRPSTS